MQIIDALIEAGKLRPIGRRNSRHYNYYSGKTWGAAESYDLCINTSHLGHEGTAKMLIEYIELRMGTIDNRM